MQLFSGSWAGRNEKEQMSSAHGQSVGWMQERNAVGWRPGHEESLAPPYLNLRPFGSKCTVLKSVLVTLLGHFGAPHSDPAHPVPLFA